jgi:UDPglucose 6-dehydrogenase
MNHKIGVIGVGMVGGPIARYFEELKGLKRGEALFLYDTNPQKNMNDDVNRADIIFVAVPTPPARDGSADLSHLESALSKISGNKIIVIKSTVTPGTTEAMQTKFPQHKILFNPEFLDAKFNWEQFINPNRQIIGATENSKDISSLILSILPDAPYKSEVGATDAELIKYAANVHYARKVNFVNTIANLAEKLGANYENIRRALAADPRFGDSHLDPNHGGYRGFGGHCLPKDTRALIALLRNQGLSREADLIEKDYQYNESILRDQGMTIEDTRNPRLP